MEQNLIISSLRDILKQTECKEVTKWRKPCYTWQGHNIVIIFRFKEKVSLGFFKGSLYFDSHQILEKPGEHSNGMRYLHFYKEADVLSYCDQILDFVKQGIQLEKDGVSVPKAVTEELVYPDELLLSFVDDPSFQEAFEQLTPGRKRAYVIYFSEPVKQETRVSRIEKYREMILLGKGMNDDYASKKRK